MAGFYSDKIYLDSRSQTLKRRFVNWTIFGDFLSCLYLDICISHMGLGVQFMLNETIVIRTLAMDQITSQHTRIKIQERCSQETISKIWIFPTFLVELQYFSKVWKWNGPSRMRQRNNNIFCPFLFCVWSILNLISGSTYGSSKNIGLLRIYMIFLRLNWNKLSIFFLFIKLTAIYDLSIHRSSIDDWIKIVFSVNLHIQPKFTSNSPFHDRWIVHTSIQWTLAQKYLTDSLTRHKCDLWMMSIESGAHARSSTSLHMGCPSQVRKTKNKE